MNKAQETANALDLMTKSIMNVKENKAAVLTPVGMERRLPVTGAPFPNDDPQEVASAAARELRRVARHLIEAATALEDLVGAEGVEASAIPEAQRAAQKEEERKADEKFADRFEQMKKAAQAAVYGDVADSTVEGGEDPPAPAAWACSEHGTESVVSLTSRKGRTYSACSVGSCTEFQK